MLYRHLRQKTISVGQSTKIQLYLVTRLFVLLGGCYSNVGLDFIAGFPTQRNVGIAVEISVWMGRMKYRIEKEVDAFRMTGDQGLWPAWLVRAWQEGFIFSLDGALALFNEGGESIDVMHGDWVVKEGRGPLKVVGSTYFEQAYQEIA